MAGPTPAEERRRSAAALALAGALALVAGFVDVVGFVRLLGVFPANQSGNVVFFGMALGGSAPAPAWRTGTAIVSFAIGTASGYVLGRRLGRRKAAVLLVLELVLLLLVLAVAGPHEGEPPTGLEGFTIIVLASLAMGIQTEVVRHVAGVGVATTYQSGAVARLGEVVTGLRGPGARRIVTEFRIVFVVFLGYVGGALIGATGAGEWRWSVVVACIFLAALTVVAFVAPPYEGDEPVRR